MTGIGVEAHWNRGVTFHSLLVEIHSLLVTRCKITQIARCKKLLVTRCKICSLLVAKNQSILLAKFACYSLQ